MQREPVTLNRQRNQLRKQKILFLPPQIMNDLIVYLGDHLFGKGANTCYFGVGGMEGDISQFKICPLQVWAVVYTVRCVCLHCLCMQDTLIIVLDP